jgi:hypothetical protein
MKPTKRLIPKDHPDYEKIAEVIQSSESVVGIDARHTHIIIIKKLLELEEKLTAVEKKLANKKAKKK